MTKKLFLRGLFIAGIAISMAGCCCGQHAVEKTPAPRPVAVQPAPETPPPPAVQPAPPPKQERN